MPGKSPCRWAVRPPRPRANCGRSSPAPTRRRGCGRRTSRGCDRTKSRVYAENCTRTVGNRAQPGGLELPAVDPRQRDRSGFARRQCGPAQTQCPDPADRPSPGCGLRRSRFSRPRDRPRVAPRRRTPRDRRPSHWFRGVYRQRRAGRAIHRTAAERILDVGLEPGGTIAH